MSSGVAATGAFTVASPAGRSAGAGRGACCAAGAGSASVCLGTAASRSVSQRCTGPACLPVVVAGAGCRAGRCPAAWFAAATGTSRARSSGWPAACTRGADSAAAGSGEFSAYVSTHGGSRISVRGDFRCVSAACVAEATQRTGARIRTTRRIWIRGTNTGISPATGACRSSAADPGPRLGGTVGFRVVAVQINLRHRVPPSVRPHGPDCRDGCRGESRRAAKNG